MLDQSFTDCRHDNAFPGCANVYFQTDFLFEEAVDNRLLAELTADRLETRELNRPEKVKFLSELILTNKLIFNPFLYACCTYSCCLG